MHRKQNPIILRQSQAEDHPQAQEQLSFADQPHRHRRTREGETSFLPFKDEIFRRDIAGKRVNFGVVVRIEKKPEREFYPSLLLNGAFD